MCDFSVQKLYFIFILVLSIGACSINFDGQNIFSKLSHIEIHLSSASASFAIPSSLLREGSVFSIESLVKQKQNKRKNKSMDKLKKKRGTNETQK